MWMGWILIFAFQFSSDFCRTGEITVIVPLYKPADNKQYISTQIEWQQSDLIFVSNLSVLCEHSIRLLSPIFAEHFFHRLGCQASCKGDRWRYFWNRKIETRCENNFASYIASPQFNFFRTHLVVPKNVFLRICERICRQRWWLCTHWRNYFWIDCHSP